MNRNLLILISAFFLFGCTHKDVKVTDKNKPNIILILADDLGWSDLGCYGSEVETPHLDKLAAEGIRFTQVYNTAKCFPSRASLLTGLYSQRTGYHKSYKQPMYKAITLGELFKMAGYTTMWSGKHHSTEMPTTRGFDHYSGLFEGASNHFNPGKQRENEGIPAQKRPDRPWVIDGELIQPYTPPEDFYTTDAFTDYALNWINQHDTQQPFFLYLAYTAPHDPLMAWSEDIEKYKGIYMEGYETLRNRRFEKQKELGLINKSYPLSRATFNDWNNLSSEEKVEADLKMAVYSAMIDRMDQNIGRLLATLENRNQLENTLIIFVSDNGASSEVVKHVEGSGPIGSVTRWTSLGADWANVSNVPLRLYKNYSYEGGIKTPMIAYWPKGITGKNRISNAPLHFIDFLPTFSEITNTTYPIEYNKDSIIPSDGLSFYSVLKNEQFNRTKPLFWQWQHGKAIRDGNWKLVSHKQQWELFNLKEDPVEENDLSKSHPVKFQQLMKRYFEWELEIGVD